MTHQKSEQEIDLEMLQEFIQNLTSTHTNLNAKIVDAKLNIAGITKNIPPSSDFLAEFLRQMHKEPYDIVIRRATDNIKQLIDALTLVSNNLDAVSNAVEKMDNVIKFFEMNLDFSIDKARGQTTQTDSAYGQES